MTNCETSEEKEPGRFDDSRNGNPDRADRMSDHRPQGQVSSSPEAEARLQSIFRAAPVGIGLLSGRILLDVNNRLCDMVGYSREELLGQNARMLYPTSEEYQRVGSEQSRQIAEDGVGTIECRWQHNNGHVMDVLLRSTPLDVSDPSKGVTFTALDITSRKKTEDELQSIFDLSLDMVCIADINTTTFVRVNPAFERTLGYRVDELIGRSFLDLIHPDDRPATEAVVRSKLRKGQSILNFENRYRCRDGSYRWLNWTSHPKLERSLTYAVARDITELKTDERALRESEQRYRALFEGADDGIFIVQDGRFVDCNSKVLNMFGCVREQILGRGPEDFSPPRQPDGYTSQTKAAEHLAAALAGAPQRFEWQHKRLDGTVFDVEVCLNALHLPAGQFVQAIIRDVTSRKQAEAALKVSEKRYRAVVEDQTEFICRFAADGTVTFVNAALCRFYGLSPNKLIGQDFDASMPPEERDRLWQRLRSLTREHPVETHENLGLLPDGRTFWGQWTNRAMFDEAGNVTEYQAVGRDITERKAAEQALCASEEKYRLLFDTADVLISVYNHQGVCQLMNRKVAALFGRQPNDFIGKSLHELHPRSAGEYVARLRRAIDSGVSLKYEDEVEFPRGTRWLLSRVHPVPDAQGVFRTVQIISQDITEQKQADEERRIRLHALESTERINGIIREATDSEQMLRDVIEATQSIFASDRAWLLYPCDPQAPSFRVPVEFTNAAYPGAKALDLEVPMHRGQAQDMRDALASEEPLACTIGTNRPVSKETAAEFGVKAQMFTAVYPKLGKPWLFGLHQCSYSRRWTVEERQLFKEIGRRLGDGLSSVLSLRNLRESEMRFRELVELLPQTVFETDAEGRFTFANRLACESFGYGHEELPNLHLADVFAPGDRQRVMENSRKHLRGEWLGDREYTVLRKNGTTFPVLLYEAAIIRDGVPMGLRGVVVDITERKNVEHERLDYEAKLRSLASELALAEERERRRIAADLHDHACQSLALSKMKLQALLKGIAPVHAEALQSICAILGETLESVRELTFDLSSPTLYKIGLEAALEELLRDKLRGEHNIMYHFSDDGKHKPLSQDVLVLLFQCVRELLINAIKHAQAHEVILDIRRDNDLIAIVVSDDGIGFDVNEVRLSPPERRSVGLFNVRERLDHVGGRLDMDSCPGQGSRFTLVAPLKANMHVAKESDHGTEDPAG